MTKPKKLCEYGHCKGTGRSPSRRRRAAVRSIRYRGDDIRDGLGREEAAGTLKHLPDLLNTIPDPMKTDLERRERQQKAFDRLMKERDQT